MDAPKNLFTLKANLARRVVSILFLLANLLPAVALAQSQIPRRIYEPVNDTQLIALRGNTHSLALPAYDHGAVSSSFPAERMLLVLRRSATQEAALQQFLQAVQNPSSAQYHQFLTPSQFGSRYGVSDSDLKTITGWLNTKGFSVARVLTGRTGIEFSGTAGQVQTAFHTAIHSYIVNGEQHYANAGDPKIPAALAPVVAGITLNNFAPRPLNRVNGPATLDPLTHHATPLFNVPSQNNSTCLDGYCFAVVPGDLATIYDTKPLLASGIDGTGVIVGIAGVSNIDTSIVQRYRQNFVPAYSATNLPKVIIDGPDPGTENQDDEIEAYLDVEMAGAVAPNATVNLYTAADSYVSDGLALAIARALDDNQASILSVSFGECEAFLGATYNLFFNDQFEQAAAQGITVLVSTGDSGSAGCDPPYNTFGPAQAVSGLFVSGLASTPYNIAVGGTDFLYPAKATLDTLSPYWNMPTASNPNNNADWSSAKSYIPEKPWDLGDPALDQLDFSPSLGGGGGGKSSCISYTGTVDSGSTANQADCHGGYPKPAWQSGFGNDTARDLPDVSLFASGGSNYSFIAICAFAGDCKVPNAGPNSVISPLQVTGLGGTSASTPAMAGIMALVVQKTGSRQGQANSVLYPLSQQTPLAFHDIAVGTNAVSCVQGTPDCGADGNLTGYNATAGYDLATGLGSVDAAILVNHWSNVTFKPTTTTLSINPASAVHNTPLTFTVNVTGGPTGGDISLLTTQSASQPQGLYTTTCAAFPCTFTYAALPGGSYDVSARYAGSNVYAASTSTAVPVNISRQNSEVAIYYEIGDTLSNGQLLQVSQLNGQTDLIYGGVISLTAIPVPANYALPTDPATIKATPATGTILVSDAGKVISAPLVLDATGHATFEDFNLPAGKHSLTVAYSGDASYSPSNTISPLATPINFTIGPTKTTLYINPYYQEILPGSGASVTASLAAAGQAGPTGNVTFSVTTPAGVTTKLPPVPLAYDATAFASTAVANIPATALGAGLPTTTLAGNNSVTASYSGDANYLPETQAAIATIYDAQVVSNIYLSTTPNAPVASQSTAITARVGWSNVLNIPGFPAGTVTFLDGATTLGKISATPDAYGNGIATLTTSTLSVGVHTITANYSGNSQFLSSTATITVTVSPAPPPVLDFTLQSTPIAIAKGETNPSATSTLTLTLNYPQTSLSTLSVSCTPPPQSPRISCATPPSFTIAAGATTATSTVTVSINARTAGLEPVRNRNIRWLAAGFALALVVPFGLAKDRRKGRAFLGLLLLFAMVSGLSACQSLHYRDVPAGAYNITVTATIGSDSHQTTIPVTIE